MAPTPARASFWPALVSAGLLSGCMQADPTLGLIPRAPIGDGSDQVVASFERRAPGGAGAYGATPRAPMPRAAIGNGGGYGGVPAPRQDDGNGGYGNGGNAGYGNGGGYAGGAPSLPPAPSGAVQSQALPPPSSAAGGYGDGGYDNRGTGAGGYGDEGYGSPAAAPAPARQAPPPSAGGQQVAALAPTGVRQVQFLPIVGAPADTVAQLAQALARNAPASNVSIVAAADGVAPLRLKGYLSASAEGGQTTVYYVWDVLDPAGERINRIQGQEAAPGGGRGDPWGTVAPATIEAIARKTLAEASRAAG